MERIPKATYTPEFRAEAVSLVESTLRACCLVLFVVMNLLIKQHRAFSRVQ